MRVLFLFCHIRAGLSRSQVLTSSLIVPVRPNMPADFTSSEYMPDCPKNVQSPLSPLRVRLMSAERKLTALSRCSRYGSLTCHKSPEMTRENRIFSMTMPGILRRDSRNRSMSRFISLMAYWTSLIMPRMTSARNIFLGEILIFIAGYLLSSSRRLRTFVPLSNRFFCA